MASCAFCNEEFETFSQIYPMFTHGEIQIYHKQVMGLTHEVAQIDLPGEIWAQLYASCDKPVDIFTGPPAPLFIQPHCDDDSLLIISGPKLIAECLKNPYHQPFCLLRPYVQAAMDLGYDYLVLSN